MPAGHCSRGLSMTVVSYISSGALSVALSERPTAPKTVSTSGKERRIRSCSCSNFEASTMEIPGSDVGMYNEEPSYSGGMNWLPSLNINGNVTIRNTRFRSSVVFRYFKQRRSTGRYKACVIREMGFSDSGRNLPFMNMTISTGTSVMAKTEEKPTASVFVHANGLNIRPSCASSKKTGRKETTMITSEKKIAGPTCFAESKRIFRLCDSERGPASED